MYGFYCYAFNNQNERLYLPILLQVVMQDLGVRLLMGGQDVHEGGRGVTGSSWGVNGSPAGQGRGQAEGGSWRPRMETLLVE